MTILRITATLDLGSASPNTYPNWQTVRFAPGGVVERLTNAEGNGQRWVPCGTGTQATRTLCLSKPDTQEERYAYTLLATCFARAGWTLTGYKATFGFCNKATLVHCEGRLTAAPSLALGREPRDKNRNREREKVSAINMKERMDALIQARNASKTTKETQ